MRLLLLLATLVLFTGCISNPSPQELRREFLDQKLELIDKMIKSGEIERFDGYVMKSPFIAEWNGWRGSAAAVMEAQAKLMGERVRAGKLTEAEADAEFKQWYDSFADAKHKQLQQARERPAIDPVAALLLLQGLQSMPRYQYQPLPVPKLSTTCWNTMAGSTIVTQCY